MAETIHPFRNTFAATSLWVLPEPVSLPSSTVVAAVLTFGDQRVDCEDGRISIRLSPERAAQSDMEQLLGVERQRALDVTVIWDDAEAEIVRVLDIAPLRAGQASTHQRNTYAMTRHHPGARLDVYTPQAAAA